LPQQRSWPTFCLGCNSNFNHNSFSDIAWFIVATFASVLFSLIAFGYLHQLYAAGVRIDPNSMNPIVGSAPGVYHMDDFSARSPPSSQFQYQPQYDPPTTAPPLMGGMHRSMDSEDDHTSGKAPDYEPGTFERVPIGDDKAPGYEYALNNDHARGPEPDREEDHEQRAQTNPFRK